MADEKLNQDKPESLNVQDQDAFTQEGTGGIHEEYPQGASVPLENYLDSGQEWEETRDWGPVDEETAAEIAAPVNIDRDVRTERNEENKEGSGSGMLGISALALSIISLFVLPVVLGITGIVLGFMARNRAGKNGAANWAIGIGAISLIIGLFILPFY